MWDAFSVPFILSWFDMSERQNKTIDAFILPTQAFTVCGFSYREHTLIFLELFFLREKTF